MNVLSVENFEAGCSGCGACWNACPAEAISAEMNAEGFYKPVIAAHRCTGCGACCRVCQIVKNDREETAPLRVVSGFAGDSAVRASGSSGALYGLMAERMLKKGGVVWGAAFDAQGKRVVHADTDETALKRILRSKYVQSFVGGAYRKVRENLKAGRRVLFCGTPCQVDGLKRYLGREYDGLITVDFVCHGVPSVKFFQETVDAMEKRGGAPVSDVRFREKRFGWRKQSLIFEYSDGREAVLESDKAPLYAAFLYSYSLNKPCFGCKYVRRHVSDITLGDHWRAAPETDDDRGISLAAANTEKGLEWISSLTGARLSDEAPDVFTAADVPHFKGTYSVGRRASFFTHYGKKGYEWTANVYLPRSLDALLRRRAFIRGAKGIVKRMLGR